MSEQPTYHIMLLPRENYWGWVAACREYALKFNVTLTPSPQNAAMFHRPNQTISIVNPARYVGYGNIVEWFRKETPRARLDVIHVPTESELQAVLAQRLADNQRIVPSELAVESQAPLKRSVRPKQDHPTNLAALSKPPIRLRWPTDYDDLLHGFGASPELYQPFELPGHEGVDIKAPLNAQVYACADGMVYRVHDGSDGHPYGIHVRVRHANGFATIYAHLNAAAVHDGQEVKAGELLGLAGSTGSATSSFLHLGLKRAGATTLGLTPFPLDYIDPTPYLYRPLREQGEGGCLIGASASSVQSEEELQAIKFTSTSSLQEIQAALNRRLFVLVQLDGDFRHKPLSPEEFVPIVGAAAVSSYRMGVRYFEVHHQPNIAPQGFGQSWQNGTDFGEWFIAVVGLLRPYMAEAKFGWPGLAPGATQGMRADHLQFLQNAGRLVGQADWVGCHCYWQTEDEMVDINGGLSYRPILDEWRDKPILITEFGNPSPTVSKQDKLRQYSDYYRILRQAPGVAAAFRM